jgi:hypothetical protein
VCLFFLCLGQLVFSQDRRRWGLELDRQRERESEKLAASKAPKSLSMSCKVLLALIWFCTLYLFNLYPYFN